MKLREKSDPLCAQPRRDRALRQHVSSLHSPASISHCRADHQSGSFWPVLRLPASDRGRAIAWSFLLSRQFHKSLSQRRWEIYGLRIEPANGAPPHHHPPVSSAAAEPTSTCAPASNSRAACTCVICSRLTACSTFTRYRSFVDINSSTLRSGIAHQSGTTILPKEKASHLAATLVLNSLTCVTRQEHNALPHK